jgi:hypothetical protein
MLPIPAAVKKMMVHLAGDGRVLKLPPDFTGPPIAP